MSEIDQTIFSYCQGHPWIEKVVIILVVYAWVALICLAFVKRK